MKNLPTAANLRVSCGQDDLGKTGAPKTGWIPKRHLPLTKQFVAEFRSSFLGHQHQDAGARSCDPVQEALLRRAGFSNASDRAPPIVA